MAVQRHQAGKKRELTDLKAEVLQGLRSSRKRIPAAYLYDEKGSRLFEEITRVEEYYVTRLENELLHRYGREIAERLGPSRVIVEYGAGSGEKARLLLRSMKNARAYVPIDIAKEQLLENAGETGGLFPNLAVVPVHGDFSRELETSLRILGISHPRTGLFLGSTIGNFEPAQAAAFLERAGSQLGPQGELLLGYDRAKDAEILERAYNDARGVTAAFNLNLLTRLNRELDATFDLDSFFHHAFFNRTESRIEMHLVSRRAQLVRVAGGMISFRSGETIHTENSYKYSRPAITGLARSAGWSPVADWSDSREYYGLQLFRRAGA